MLTRAIDFVDPCCYHRFTELSLGALEVLHALVPLPSSWGESCPQ